MRWKKATSKKIFAGKRLLLLALFLIPGMALLAQQKNITGTVKNFADGVPLADVTVQIKGTKTGTSTNGKGEWSLPAGENKTLVFSAIGYTAAQENTGSKSVINIELKKASNDLEGVVVTALGIKREERALGYSTTVVKGEELTGALSGNWTDALSGKVAGLNLVRSNSGPAGSNKIILRGENNLTGNNEALIVVDGVIINQGSGRRSDVAGEAVYGTSSDNMPADYGSGLNDINPEDIETVSVLKGPGAAALYGGRAANGAIIITTKSGGKKKKGLGITFNSNASVEQVNRWPDLQNEYGQGVDGSPYYSFQASPDGPSTSATSSAYGPRFEGQMFYQYDPALQGQGKTRTPWVAYPDKSREFFNTGSTLTNTLTIDGSTEKTSARFSFTNATEKWIIPNTGYKRNSVALSVSSAVTDKLKISAKINYTNKASDNLPGAGYGNQSIMYWYIFWQPNADVDWLKNYWVNGQDQRKIFYPFSSFPENPYAVAHEFINSSTRNAMTGNVQASYDISKELSLQLRTSMDFGYERRAQERPYDAGSKYQKGSYRTQGIFSQELNADFLLRYAKKLGRNIELTATAGGSALRNNYNKDEVRADSLTSPGIFTMSNSAGPLVTLPYNSKYSINSFYGLITGSYKKFLYADFTARKDWYSVLATPTRTDNVGAFYPSASMSFIASEVLRLPAMINFAKLRFSAAGVGSGGTTPYRTAYNYASAGSIYSGGLTNPGTLANPNLKPLNTVTYEAGANIKMFKSRLGIDVAVYSGYTKNQILDRVVDRSSGYARTIINAGRVDNKGIEVAVNAVPVQTRGGFKWTANIVYSANHNEITSLADSSVVLRTGPVGGGQIVAKVGGSMGDLYGKGYVRAPDGQIVYDAKTGFALLSPDVVYLGNTIPKGKIGFSNEFQYKGFRLSLLFDAQFGGVAHSLTHYKLAEQGKLTSTLPGRYNGIIGNGVVLDASGKYVPNTTIATDIDEYYRSHWGIDNAEGSTFSTDFIKFREARFDYTLNQKFVKRLGLQRVTVGVYGRDLFIWSPWPIFDPEFGTLSGTDIVQGFEVGQFPSTRTMGFNLVVGL